MANTTLAQDEQYLKRLDQTFDEIRRMRTENCDALRDIEAKIKDAYDLMETSWAHVIELLATSKYCELMLQKFDPGKS